MCRTVLRAAATTRKRACPSHDVLSVPPPIVGTVTTSTGGPDARQHAAAPHGGGAQGADRSEAGETSSVAGKTAPRMVQGTLDGLASPIAQAAFVVVDLETTGGSPADGAITELAAVRTHGGGADAQDTADQEFATLVNPGRAIPPHVAMLTGITDALVATAPRIEDVLPRFVEFAAGAVLVAHNAPFDIGFLDAACAANNVSLPRLQTLDTAALARQLLTTDEVRDCRLASLAEFFGACTPSHRALDDARATAVVLHGLIGRLAERGVHTLEALRGVARPPVGDTPRQRRMRTLTAGVPRKPGVCIFTAADGRVLHVVRSSDMHARATGYFAAAETRRQIREMVDKTACVEPLSCATALEAEVAEIRLIALHRPPYASDHDEGGNARQASRAAELAAVRLLTAARPRFSGGWDVARIRYGRLEGTAVFARGAAATRHNVEAGTARVPPPPPDAPVARLAEATCLLAWLGSPGVRLIRVEGTWCCRVGDAGCV